MSKPIQILLAVTVIVGYVTFSRLSKQPVKISGSYVTDPTPVSDTTLKHEGNEFHFSELQGKWVVLFFGYTSCPDVCPTTLAYLNREYGRLLENRPAVQVVMVSVDPEKDNPKKLNEYVTAFHPDFIGVTGNEENLKELTESVGTDFHHHDEKSESRRTVEHSADIFVIDPQGNWVSFYRPPLKNGILSEDLRHLILRGGQT